MNKPTMPNIRSRKLPSGKTTYFLDYFDVRNGKRARSTIGPRNRDAQEKAKELYDEMMAAFIGAPEQRFFEMSITDLVENFFRSRQSRKAALLFVTESWLDISRTSWPLISPQLSLPMMCNGFISKNCFPRSRSRTGTSDRKRYSGFLEDAVQVRCRGRLRRFKSSPTYSTVP